MRNLACPTLATVILAVFSSYATASIASETTVSNRENRLADVGIASRTVLGITLGRSTLNEVQEKLGPAKLWSSGDAATAEQKVCYVTKSRRPVVVVFASNSEMAGPPENQVTDIRILRSEAYAERSKCVAISAENIRTPNGLELGINGETVRKILGIPSRGTPAKPIYFWSVDRPLPKSDKNYHYWISRREECFDGKEPFVTVSSEIHVVFDRDVVVGLSFERMESIC